MPSAVITEFPCEKHIRRPITPPDADTIRVSGGIQTVLLVVPDNVYRANRTACDSGPKLAPTENPLQAVQQSALSQPTCSLDRKSVV